MDLMPFNEIDNDELDELCGLGLALGAEGTTAVNVARAIAAAEGLAATSPPRRARPLWRKAASLSPECAGMCLFIFTPTWTGARLNVNT